MDEASLVDAVVVDNAASDDRLVQLHISLSGTRLDAEDEAAKAQPMS